MALFTIITLSTLLSVISGAGFDYPASLASPMDLHMLVHAGITNDLSFIGQYETPIAIRYASIIDAVNWNCVAVYDSDALDAITKQRPIVVADNETILDHGDSETRVLCMTYAMTIVSIDYMPESANHAKSFITSVGLDNTFVTMNDDVSKCGVGDITCLQDIADLNSYFPEIMASIIAKQAIDYLSSDGFNADGSINKNGGVCTANCRPFSDTTGYQPKNTGNHWEPLVEDNGKGFFYEYSHVTPHIGTEAVTKIVSRQELNNKVAPDPDYNYVREKRLVINRLAELAVNDTQKMLVEFFDNKLLVHHTLRLTLDELLKDDDEWSLELRALWMAGYSASEYDAVLQTWKEKVFYDLIRPTSLIKRDGATKITTYAGPHKGLQTIDSADFEAYIRVMPHSEYPSGSGCICGASKHFTTNWIKSRFPTIERIPVTIPAPNSFIPAGSSLIEPGLTPQTDLYITIDTVREVGNICRDSRLWGGMHFTRSVRVTAPLCEYIGTGAVVYADNIAGNYIF